MRPRAVLTRTVAALPVGRLPLGPRLTVSLGETIARIGFAIGLTTPYTLKFLWAPLVDRLPIPVLTRLFGQRRSWLFVIQALLVATTLMQLSGPLWTLLPLKHVAREADEPG